MDFSEAYAFVLADCFMTALILPIQGNVVIIAMKVFGGYNMTIALFASTIGAMAATAINFGFGVLIRSASYFACDPDKNDNLTKLINFSQKFGRYGLLLVWIPVIGGIYTTVLGYSRLPLKTILIWSSLSYLGYYIVITSSF